ncbi:hypothetical protein [Rickettsia hoogstraalii]|nr:hypothetical protein [Rickettsia hoogstraalii]
MREETTSFDEAISGYLTRLPRRFAPRNDDLDIQAAISLLARNDIGKFQS